MMWSEKYRPQTVSDMIGNEEVRATITKWLATWKTGTKPILLIGPPGIGKTTISYILSKQFGYDMISLNASDARTKSKINQTLAPVLGNISVMGSPLIFIDEVDGIHGRADFGGADALLKILKEATVPIILAANYADSTKMKNISKAVKTVIFKPLPPRLIRIYLQSILKKQGAVIPPGTLIKIVNNSRGDIRSILNTAQSIVTGFDPPTEKSFEPLNIEEGINAFFKAQSAQEAGAILYSMRVDPRQKINAFYSSIVSYDNNNNKSSNTTATLSIPQLLEIISQADMLYGKIIRTQNWRLLRYLDAILLQLYQPNSPFRYTAYNLSWPLLNRIRWDGAKIKSLCTTLAKIHHVSQSTITTMYLPFILLCTKNKNLDLLSQPNSVIPQDEFTDIIKKEMELLKN